MLYALIWVVLGLPSLGSTRQAAAQHVDSARAAARPAGDTIIFGRSPIRPRTAFLRSLLVPGWGQASLDRGAAGGVFVLMEAISITMLVKSKRDLDLAKRFRNDSIFQGYRLDDNGLVVTRVDSISGDTVPVLQYERNPIADRIKPRQQHLEDWIALLIFNHFFAGADAFVAAHLGDLPPRLSVRPRRDGVTVSARIQW